MPSIRLLMIGNNDQFYKNLNVFAVKNKWNVSIEYSDNKNDIFELIQKNKNQEPLFFIADFEKFRESLDFYNKVHSMDRSIRGILLNDKDTTIRVNHFHSFSKNRKNIFEDIYDEINLISHKIKPYDVFCSYSNFYLDNVFSICKELKKRKVKLWLDKWNLVPGDSFDDVIEDKIKSIQTYFIFIGNKMGKYQQKEIDLIIMNKKDQKEKRIIPIILKVYRKKELDPGLKLNRYHYVDLRNIVFKKNFLDPFNLLEKAVNNN